MQFSMFGVSELTPPVNNETTFVDNMKLPVHRWYRYSAGFSAMWVRQLLRQLPALPSLVLDPFAGSGTTLLACDESSVPSVGVDSHPFVVRIARAKLLWNTDIDAFACSTKQMLAQADVIYRGASRDGDEAPELLRKAFLPESLRKLESLRLAYCEIDADNDVRELCWLALTSTLRAASGVGTAPWQYVLPRKQKARVAEPFDAFQLQSEMMIRDMTVLQNAVERSQATMLLSDARTLAGVPDNSVDLVVTSPPYANNYDYADATRLEMTFWREISGWGDLQQSVRKHLIRSCTQHASAERLSLDSLLADSLLQPIIDELQPICQELDAERGLHGGNKSYHLMAAAYFSDIARVWQSLRRVCKESASLCFVLGDSAPYGVHLPVIKWYAKLAQAAGFENVQFVHTRDRNVKWANRTHTVLLHEGQLWINSMATENPSSEQQAAELGGSASHTLGQLIGNFFQNFFLDSLQNLAEQHGMYCDHQEPRPGVRGSRKKVSWKDLRGTSHDLDYVIEREGNRDKQGHPKAFIELAWRRYTKHSRNKAGKIEGALFHLGETFKGAFLGAILAGEWSPGSLEQMKARGIRVLHIPFEIVATTFDAVGINLRYSEKAPESEVWTLVHKWRQLDDEQLTAAREIFYAAISESYQSFLNELGSRLDAKVVSIRILSLFGEEFHFDSIDTAIQELSAYDQVRKPDNVGFVRYEVNIVLTNGADITGKFLTAEDASDFLKMYN